MPWDNCDDDAYHNQVTYCKLVSGEVLTLSPLIVRAYINILATQDTGTACFRYCMYGVASPTTPCNPAATGSRLSYRGDLFWRFPQRYTGNG